MEDGMNSLRAVYPLAVIVAVGTAIYLDRMGVRNRWLAGGFLVLGLGAILFVAGIALLRGAASAAGKHALSIAAAASLGAGLVFIGLNALWPSHRLDIVGYVLLALSVIPTLLPWRPRGHHIGA